jgi:hypothetical protein
MTEERSTSIITTMGHFQDFVVGNYLVTHGKERRWWVKLWYWVTFRKVPPRKFKLKITSVDKSTVTVKGQVIV